MDATPNDHKIIDTNRPTCVVAALVYEMAQVNIHKTNNFLSSYQGTTQEPDN